jgi:hypothetical protein
MQEPWRNERCRTGDGTISIRGSYKRNLDHPLDKVDVPEVRTCGSERGLLTEF